MGSEDPMLTFFELVSALGIGLVRTGRSVLSIGQGLGRV